MIKRLIGGLVFRLAFTLFYVWMEIRQSIRKHKERRRG